MLSRKEARKQEPLARPMPVQANPTGHASHNFAIPRATKRRLVKIRNNKPTAQRHAWHDKKQHNHKQKQRENQNATPTSHPAAPPMATRKRRSKEPNQTWAHPTTAVPIALGALVGCVQPALPNNAIQTFGQETSHILHAKICIKTFSALTQANPDPQFSLQSGLPSGSNHLPKG